MSEVITFKICPQLSRPIEAAAAVDGIIGELQLTTNFAVAEMACVCEPGPQKVDRSAAQIIGDFVCQRSPAYVCGKSREDTDPI